MLPKQLFRLAAVAELTGAAVGVAQEGSVLYVDTGRERFAIDAGGHNV